jgi:AcrR family transcriptional regulator
VTDAVKNKKASILSEAVKLFAEKGYHNTTLDEVAQRLGVTKAALYYYFDNKAHIIRVIMRKHIDSMSQAVKLVESELIPSEKLRDFVKLHIKNVTENIDATRILFEQLHALPPRTRQSIENKEREYDHALQAILLEGVEDGSFNIDDVNITSYAIIGLCNWTYHWYKPDGRLTSEQISDIVVNLIEKGILPE